MKIRCCNVWENDLQGDLIVKFAVIVGLRNAGLCR